MMDEPQKHPLSLRATDLSYGVGEKKLLEGVSLTVSPGERMTLVGENGVGKSTLLRILAGTLKPQSGHLERPENVGYLPQAFEETADQLVLQHMIETVECDTWKSHFQTYPKLPFKDWLAGFNVLGGHNILRSLGKLGVPPTLLTRPLSSLSGGEKTKVHLASLIHQNPDLLLLDEPTNHLDIQGIRWLETRLVNYMGILVMITHDRTLINHAATRLSELSPEHTLHHFKGGYGAYLEQQERLRLKREQQRKAQEDELKTLQGRLAEKKSKKALKKGRSDSNKLAFNARGERHLKGLGRQRRALEAKREKLQETLVEIPHKRYDFAIDFGARETVKVSLRVEDLAYSTLHKKLFQSLNFTLYAGDKLCVMGGNGAGKTTLLKLIAKDFDPKSGNVSFSGDAKIGFLDQEQERFDLTQNPLDYLRTIAPELGENEIYHLLKKFGIRYTQDVVTPFSQLSVGTRRKVQLAGIVSSGATVLLLDEPSNHLDLVSLEQVEEQLAAFPGIVIVVTHDRYFVDQIGAKTLTLKPPKRKKGEVYADEPG